MCQLGVGRTYLKADSFSIGLSESDHCEYSQKEKFSTISPAKSINPKKIFILVKLMKLFPNSVNTQINIKSR